MTENLVSAGDAPRAWPRARECAWSDCGPSAPPRARAADLATAGVLVLHELLGVPAFLKGLLLEEGRKALEPDSVAVEVGEQGVVRIRRSVLNVNVVVQRLLALRVPVDAATALRLRPNLRLEDHPGELGVCILEPNLAEVDLSGILVHRECAHTSRTASRGTRRKSCAGRNRTQGWGRGWRKKRQLWVPQPGPEQRGGASQRGSVTLGGRLRRVG